MKVSSGVQLAPVALGPTAARLFSDYSKEYLTDDQIIRRHPTIDPSLLQSRQAEIVFDDFLTLNIDFSRVPVSDLLDFRAEQGPAFAAYNSEVRKLATHLILLPNDHGLRALKERAEWLRYERDRLMRESRSMWSNLRPARILALLAGLAAVYEGSPISGVLSILSSLIPQRNEQAADVGNIYDYRSGPAVG